MSDEPNQRPLPPGLRGVWKGLLRRVWYLPPESTLRLQLSAAQGYRLLQMAAKPSVERLHLRKLFVNSRRYFPQPRPDGSFRLETTRKVAWHPSAKRRTASKAVLHGDFEGVQEGVVQLRLRSHVRPWYLVMAFAWPTFMTSILIFMPWSPAWIALFIVALYALSWVGHRAEAMLEVHEMLVFIETALDDFIAQPAPSLDVPSADVVYSEQFATAQRKFYQ